MILGRKCALWTSVSGRERRSVPEERGRIESEKYIFILNYGMCVDINWEAENGTSLLKRAYTAFYLHPGLAMTCGDDAADILRHSTNFELGWSDYLLGKKKIGGRGRDLGFVRSVVPVKIVSPRSNSALIV